MIGAHAGSRQSTGAAFAGCVIPRALSSVYRPGVEVSVPAERRSAGAGMCVLVWCALTMHRGLCLLLACSVRRSARVCRGKASLSASPRLSDTRRVLRCGYGGQLAKIIMSLIICQQGIALLLI